jgi:hypothetical protein
LRFHPLTFSAAWWLGFCALFLHVGRGASLYLCALLELVELVGLALACFNFLHFRRVCNFKIAFCVVCL